MNLQNLEGLRDRLLSKKRDLTARLERIRSNVLRGLDPDSSERAKELEDRDVVDALGREAQFELLRIAATLRRMDDGEFGTCLGCGGTIEEARLKAYPHATECVACTGRRRTGRD